MPNSQTIIAGAPGRGAGSRGSFFVFTGEGANWTQTQEVQYSGVGSTDQFGDPETSLAATQKEVFIGSQNSEKVIRYRI
jgi:hypothetical protein